MSKLVPFGKYRGRAIEEMAADREYCDWLAQQPWFRERFGDVYNVVINYGSEPTETPEHNALQARFLDHAFCMAVAEAAMSGWRNPLALYKADTWELERRAKAVVRLDEPVTVRAVGFEENGWDVAVSFQGGISLSDDYRSWSYGSNGRLLVECKPTLGDDYPAVLRQVKRYACNRGDVRAVLIGSYTGRAVSFSDIKKIFASSGFSLVLVSECGDIP